MRSRLFVPAMLLGWASGTHAQVAAFAFEAPPPSVRIDSTVTLPAGTHIFAQLQRPLDTHTAKGGDSIYMQVTFPVTLNAQVVVPAGTYALATLDSVVRHGLVHHTIAFGLRLTSFVFANGYVASVRQAAQAQPRNPNALGPAEQPMALLLASGAAPLAGTAVGAIAGGEHGTFVGGAIGTAVGLTTAAIALAHAGDFSLAPGFALDLRAEGPLVLDAQRSADAARIPPSVQSHGNQAQQCYTPGTPGTPDIVIPGTPATPPVGDFPGTPGTPDTIIPGTPATTGSWHPCP